MGQWANYFLATAGVASPLTGLIFIGLSINLQKILKITKLHVPSRALGSLLLLTNILIVSSLCLAPKQQMVYMGSEILATGLMIWVINTWLDFISYKRVEKNLKPQYFKTLFFTQIAYYTVYHVRGRIVVGFRKRNLLPATRNQHFVY